MKILRFTLSGRQAFFKQPEVNTYYYFTYGHIHKVALLGMLGAILGYSGYTGQTFGSLHDRNKEMAKFPEFYDRLKNLKISIIPVCNNGNFPKKMVSFNNSVGYASKEQGGNLIIKQQWLENPKWYVYIMLDCEEAQKAADSILHRKCVYMPYLGTNDHPADIIEAAVISGEMVSQPEHIDSFFTKGTAEVDLDDFEQENPFKYEENLPCGLDEELNMYVFKRYTLTNLSVTKAYKEVYKIADINGTQYSVVFD